MARKFIKNNGNAGELSPQLDARTDHVKYFSGWSTASNVIVLPYGGVIKRPGSKFIAKAKGACKLFKFEFSSDDNMMLEFGNTYIRFFKDDERIMNDAVSVVDITLTGTDPVSIEATGHGYSTGDVVRFYAISGKATELTYTFNSHNEYTITRTDANNFTLDDTDSSDFTGVTFTSGNVKSVYEVTTPYDVSDVFEIHVAYSGDVIYIAHGDYFPRKNSRTSDNSWTFAEVDFKYPPFLTGNTIADDYLECYCGSHTGSNNASVLTDSTQSWTVDSLIGYTIYNISDGCSGTITDNDATTITVGGGLSGGSDNDFDTNDKFVILEGYYIPSGLQVTLVATGHTPFITTNDVHDGSYWQLKHTRKDNVIDNNPDNATNTTPTGDGIRIKGRYSFEVSDFTDGTDSVKLWRKEGNGQWQEHKAFTVATAYTSEEVLDDVYYTYTTSAGSTTDEVLTAQNQINEGVIQIDDTTYTTTSAIGTVKSPVYFNPSSANNQTSMWAESAWSEYRGFPNTVCLHENRLWFAGSTNNPKGLWGSKSGYFENFQVGANDNDAINKDISEGDVSGIQWLMAHRVMVAGTSTGEYMIAASNPQNAITPNDIVAKYQSSYGSNKIQPVLLNDSIIYTQRNGKKIRAMYLNDYGDRLLSDDATVYANHLFEKYSPTCMVVQRIPDSLCWVVRSDGTLCVLAYEPGEELKASWTRLVTGSLYDTPAEQYTSIAVISGDSEDDIWISTYRTINETGTYYIEKFTIRNPDQEDEAVMVDCANIVTTGGESQDIIIASDTVRFGSGIFGSSYFGGTT